MVAGGQSDEKHPTQPVNPYGRGNLMVEQMLADFVDHAWRFAAAMQRSPDNHGVAGTVAAEGA